MEISNRKLAAIKKHCECAAYPRTFAARLAEFPPELLQQLTAKQIAAVIDGPVEKGYSAGFAACERM